MEYLFNFLNTKSEYDQMSRLGEISPNTIVFIANTRQIYKNGIDFSNSDKLRQKELELKEQINHLRGEIYNQLNDLATRTKEESDRLETERLAKEEKLAAREQRRKLPKYADGTVVLTKDGEYFQVYDGYYSEYDDDIAYDAVPCTETGKWITPRNDYEDLTVEIYQKDIQRKIK